MTLPSLPLATARLELSVPGAVTTVMHTLPISSIDGQISKDLLTTTVTYNQQLTMQALVLMRLSINIVAILHSSLSKKKKTS